MGAMLKPQPLFGGLTQEVSYLWPLIVPPGLIQRGVFSYLNDLRTAGLNRVPTPTGPSGAVTSDRWLSPVPEWSLVWSPVEGHVKQRPVGGRGVGSRGQPEAVRAGQTHKALCKRSHERRVELRRPGQGPRVWLAAFVGEDSLGEGTGERTAGRREGCV